MRSKPLDELGSGALAASAGVSVDTLRHYERRGLLPRAKRLANGYRRFPPAAVARVRLIQRALAMGFGLEELAGILRSREKGRAPCEEVRALARVKLEEVDRRVEELIAFRETLRSTLADWDRRLEGCGPNEPARLLESLSKDLQVEPTGSSLWRGAKFDRRRNRKERNR